MNRPDPVSSADPTRAAPAASGDAPRLPTPSGVGPGRANGTGPIDSRLLFGDLAEVEIDHQGVRYRLRRTALGKLILTK